MPSSATQHWLAPCVALALATLGVAPRPASPLQVTSGGPSGDSLIVFHAGSLAGLFGAVVDTLRATAPELNARFERGGSVELALRALGPGKLPDVIGLADDALFPVLLLPRASSWYASFGGNAMVVAYGPRARGLPITAANWPAVLQGAGVRAARGDPALDPGGYRAVMLFQLAQRHYGRPGLADSLERAVQVLPVGGASPYDRLRSGDLDYLITYRSSASAAGLEWQDLPAEIDLSIEAHAEDYAQASVRITPPGGGPAITLRGRPIRYGVTIPRQARHPEAAQRFVAFLLSPRGDTLLQSLGFSGGPPARITGEAPSGVLPRAGP
jgi:molybdate/tungstate transport system substrate-binding protein